VNITPLELDPVIRAGRCELPAVEGFPDASTRSRHRRTGGIRWGLVSRRALIATAALAATLWLVLYPSTGHYGADFHGGMWKAGNALLKGEPIYAAPDVHVLRAKGNEFIPPPPLAVLAVPFSLLPFGLAILLFNGVCVLGLAGALRMLGVRDRGLYVIALCSLPFVESLAMGQPDGLFALGVAAAWRYRDSWRGAVATGALIAAKLFAWPLIVWLLVTRRFRLAAVALASIIGLVASSWACAGFQGLAQYPRLLAADTRAFERVSHSIGAAAIRLGSTPQSAEWVAVAVATAVAIAVVGGASSRDQGWFAAAFTFGLMTSPILWMHYLVPLLAVMAVARKRADSLWLLTTVLWLAPTVPPRMWQVVLVLVVVIVIAIRAVAVGPRRWSGQPSPSSSSVADALGLGSR
jgi:alpha-1,2-mannosyltransferase